MLSLNGEARFTTTTESSRTKYRTAQGGEGVQESVDYPPRERGEWLIARCSIGQSLCTETEAAVAKNKLWIGEGRSECQWGKILWTARPAERTIRDTKKVPLYQIRFARHYEFGISTFNHSPIKKSIILGYLYDGETFTNKIKREIPDSLIFFLVENLLRCTSSAQFPARPIIDISFDGTITNLQGP